MSLPVSSRREHSAIPPTAPLFPEMINLVPSDPTWPACFAAEAAEIRRRFGDEARRIEHVGSTAVPGLAAKPVIDLQVSVASLAPVARYRGWLAELGYVHVDLGDFDKVYPFFQKPAAWPTTHHVHLCVSGSPEETRHLVFRDFLRRHPDVAAEYERLKRRLAAENHGETLESRERYSLAKTDFIAGVMARAAVE